MPLRLRRVFAKVSCSAAPARLAVTAMHLCQTCLRICTPADTAEANLLFGHRGISVSNADNNGAQLPLQPRSKVCHEGRLPGIRNAPRQSSTPSRRPLSVSTKPTSLLVGHLLYTGTRMFMPPPLQLYW